MREILFRAKQKDKGNWVEGYYIRQDETTYCFKEDYERHPENTKHYIVFDMPTDWGLPNRHLMAEIDPETICQYTGLTDKNGKRIWENDILKGFEYPFLCDGEFNYFATVEWSEEYKYFFLYTIKNSKSTVRGISEGNSELFEGFSSNDWEIIGNIFDDPELLKGEWGCRN